MSLYTIGHTHIHTCTAASLCESLFHRPPSESPRLFENGTWFHGIGSYVQLSASQHGVNLTAQPLRVELAFRTYSEDGLLFQVLNTLMTAQSTSPFGGKFKVNPK